MILRQTIKVDGVLTDVTSVVLSDPTGAYGVKRDDTDAVIVADGTAMTHVSTGVYEYTFTDPEEGLTYTYWVEMVYLGETYRFEKTVQGIPPTTIELIPEDGTVVADANTYSTIDELDAYHAARGHVGWGVLDPDVKAAAAVRATDYIDKRFAALFRGERLYKRDEQALEWPRIEVWDDEGDLLVDANEIPVMLKRAHAEYALRAAQLGELAPDPLLPVPTQDFSSVDLPSPSTSPASGNIQAITTKVDVVEKSITYNVAPKSKTSGSLVVSDDNIPEYPAADMWLEPLLKSRTVTLLRG